MSEDVAVLAELDYCVGCYACQTACQEYNKLPVKETRMRCVLTVLQRLAHARIESPRQEGEFPVPSSSRD